MRLQVQTSDFSLEKSATPDRQDNMTLPPEPLPKPDVLSLVNTPDRDTLLAALKQRLDEGMGFTVATLNLDHIVKLRQQPAFRDAYARHSHVVADGNPIVWLRRVMGRPVALVPGSELVMPLADLARQADVPVALLGATDATLALAAARMQADLPGLRIVARIAPPFGFDPSGAEADRILSELDASGARLCFLALGAPKQEILAIRGAEKLPRCGFVSIGAGLDFIAGTQQRAPAWVRRIAMEWFWRMATNPVRLTKRYAQCFAILPGLFWSARRARLLQRD